MTNTYDRYNVTVRVLTPMHIGNGRLLLNEYDYAIRQGHTWRINEAEFLDAHYAEDPKIIEQLEQTPPAQLLNPTDFANGSKLFRYVMKGTPRSNGVGAQLREQIKSTLTDSPYLPGTALKGGLRTALAWHGWMIENLQTNSTELERKREFAGQRFENQLFGLTPNKNLMRALIVSDSDEVSPAQLMVANVRVVTAGGLQGAPIEVEAIRPETTFRLTVKIDRALFSDWARSSGLRLQHEDWLTELASITHTHSKDRISAEAEWFKNARNATTPASVYNELAQSATKASPTQCLMQLGWGTGWGSKTFGSRLQNNDDFMERIINSYRLARGRRHIGDDFPKSRRITMHYQRDPRGNIAESAGYPLGWAWVSFKKAN